ncbi:MAG: response regulator [Mariprofundus sp.]
MADILVTDDSMFLRRRTCAILKQTGHNIIEAVNGNQCLEIIADNPPDILFLDLVMPELDGFGVLKALQDADYHIPVIVLTADIQAAVRTECMQLGAAAFINKPPEEDKVLAALTAALASLETPSCS